MGNKKISTVFLLAVFCSLLHPYPELVQEATSSIENVMSYVMIHVQPYLMSQEALIYDSEQVRWLMGKIIAEQRKIAMCPGTDATDLVFFGNMFDDVHKRVDERRMQDAIARQELPELLARLRLCKEKKDLEGLVQISRDVQGRIEKRNRGVFTLADVIHHDLDLLLISRSPIDALEGDFIGTRFKF